MGSGIGTNGGGTVVLLGTTKGVFLARPQADGGGWELDGPHFPGEEVYALAYDGRGGRGRLWAAPHSPFWGTTLRFSDDLGATWSGKEEVSVRFPEDSGLALMRIWQIRPGSEAEAGVIRMGVEPACLFISRDAGDTWRPVEGLLNHPHRDRWEPGGGGLCLHTIVTDGEPGGREMIAISAAGAYRSDDGGASWTARNHGVRAEFLPDKHPEFGQCVHKIVHHPSHPGRLFLQNHWGLYRSDDWGDAWTDIANGVPSDFGFAMAMHPHDPDTVYIVPLESDGFRCTPEAKLRVYRTRDGGATWEGLGQGLPQENAYETVLRDALTTHAPGQVFFGTRSGKVFASANDGDAWELVCDGLPPVVCVRACDPGAG